MGILVLFLTAPVWIPAVIFLLVWGLKSDEKVRPSGPRRFDQHVCLYDKEGKIVDIFKEEDGKLQPGFFLDPDDFIPDEIRDEL